MQGLRHYWPIKRKEHLLDRFDPIDWQNARHHSYHSLSITGQKGGTFFGWLWFNHPSRSYGTCNALIHLDESGSARWIIGIPSIDIWCTWMNEVIFSRQMWFRQFMKLLWHLQCLWLKNVRYLMGIFYPINWWNMTWHRQ